MSYIKAFHLLSSIVCFVREYTYSVNCPRDVPVEYSSSSYITVIPEVRFLTGASPPSGVRESLLQGLIEGPQVFEMIEECSSSVKAQQRKQYYRSPCVFEHLPGFWCCYTSGLDSFFIATEVEPAF